MQQQPGDPSPPPKRRYRRPTVTSERVDETVLALRCKKTPATPGPQCQLIKKFYG